MNFKTLFCAVGKNCTLIYKHLFIMEGFPRRSKLEENTPAELAIRKAMEEVEKMGADVKLTDAVIKLDEAFNLIADFTDGK